MSDQGVPPEVSLQEALEEMARLNRESLDDEIEIGVLHTQVSELQEVLSFERAQGRLMRDTLERIVDPKRPSRADDGDAFRNLARSVLRSLERGREEYLPDRSPQFIDGARYALHRCIAWLHAEASRMNDPRARDLLNSAAFGMGCWKKTAVAELTEDTSLRQNDIRN